MKDWTQLNLYLMKNNKIKEAVENQKLYNKI